MSNPSSTFPNNPLANLLDEMIAARNAVCTEYALNVDHRHCIGCTLVMDHMRTNHPTMEYGTQDQWVEESAFCALHERQMFEDFLRQRGIGK